MKLNHFAVYLKLIASFKVIFSNMIEFSFPAFQADSIM